jgi:hypothetical protein
MTSGVSARAAWPTSRLTYGEVVAKAVVVKVTGRVQGVSFRWYASQ